MKFLSRFLFNDAQVLIKIAKRRHLQESDMLEIPDDIKPNHQKNNFDVLDYKDHKRFLWSTIYAHKLELIPGYLWYLASTIVSLFSPILINQFLKILSKGINNENFVEALVLAFLLGASGILVGAFIQQYFFIALRVCQQIQNLLNEKIFKHTLKVTLTSRQNNQLGNVVNHMSSDAESVADFVFMLIEMIINVLILLAVIAMLFYYIGLSTLTAIVIFSIMIPLTKFLSKKLISLEEEMMNQRDKRVNLMSQVLNAIRVIKYYSWEDSIESEVMDVRNKELGFRRRLARSEVLSGIIYISTTSLVLFATLLTHSLRGEHIDIALIFTCVSLFALLNEPIGELAHIISRVTNAFVSSKRVLKYLREETKEPLKVLTDKNSSYGIDFKNLSASYKKSDDFILKNIDLTIKPKSSIAIIGSVGAGKTTLLYSILDELCIIQGSLNFTNDESMLPNGVKPKIAYLPQEAFIINTTLKENITFGNDFDETFLNHAIQVTSLEHDIKILGNDLSTEIGEKGVNLSGGQKQRVGLARAVISKPEIVLLDDPLSAVDPHTELELCDKLLFGEWKNITRVVVTHRLEYLSKFDKIVLLTDGKILAQGSFKELIQNSIEFKNFYAEHSQTVDHNTQDNSEINKTDVKKSEDIHTSRITDEEDRQVGAVKKDVYLSYILALGGKTKAQRIIVLTLLVLSASIVGLAPLVQKYWLSHFSTHQDQWKPLIGIGIYGLIGLATLLLTAINNFFWLDRGIKAGINLHNQMLRSILNTNIRFFDSTPVGRIIQRFSRDVESVDIHLQWSFVSVINCILQVLISLGLIISVLPIMILFIVPIFYIYYKFQEMYRAAAREAKRFDSVNRSPRFAHFKETIQGTTVIKAYSKENWFINSFYQKLEKSQKMFYSHYMLNRWFSSRVPLIGGLVAMLTTLTIVVSSKYNALDSGTAGLITIYSLSFWQFLNWGIRMFADIETRMTSIERLNYFAKLPKEESNDSTLQVPDSWPTKGEIKVENLHVKYAPHLPFVLKGIDCHIKAQSKVGIKGRTGSGKSTFFQTLFRFVEVTKGRIIIDDLDISKIPLKRLRQSLAIIPQDPTLFAGTIRNNLDRYNLYSNEQILDVLKHTGLDSHINSLPNGLNAVVTENGQNFSQGQKQLLCLARAMLLKSKIIVLDEATASVDVQTDNLIQKVIRDELKDVTVLIIAHRLGTIKDCDQVIELQNGILV